MNNLNLNDKRVRQAVETLFRNYEFEQCEIATDYLGIEWLEKSQILMAPITNKNYEKELWDWRVSAVIHYGIHFTWVATGDAEWNDEIVLEDNHTTFKELLDAIKECEENEKPNTDDEEEKEEEAKPKTCEKCFLIECCCEADKIQVEEDNARAKKEGYVELPNGKWRKETKREQKSRIVAENIKKRKDETDRLNKLRVEQASFKLNTIYVNSSNRFIKFVKQTAKQVQYIKMDTKTEKLPSKDDFYANYLLHPQDVENPVIHKMSILNATGYSIWDGVPVKHEVYLHN